MVWLQFHRDEQLHEIGYLLMDTPFTVIESFLLDRMTDEDLAIKVAIDEFIRKHPLRFTLEEARFKGIDISGWTTDRRNMITYVHDSDRLHRAGLLSK